MIEALNSDGILVVIPARYASSRFPGKALADLNGKTVVERCYHQCRQVMPASCVVVATDDIRIEEFCRSHNMNVEMTSPTCLTGTDRVAEVATKRSALWYLNVQGDEPFLDPAGLTLLIHACRTVGEGTQVVNAFSLITSEEEFRSPNVPKIVCSSDGKLLYASRGAIPTTKSLDFVTAKRQIGLYAFTALALKAFSGQVVKTAIEKLEDIEILRFLEIGFSVQMIEVPSIGIAIDTPQDLERAKNFLRDKMTSG